MTKSMDLLVYFWPQNFQILKTFSIFLGGGGGVPQLGEGEGTSIVLILKTLRYLPFFRNPSSAINFECQLLSAEQDHDYEIEKLC